MVGKGQSTDDDGQLLRRYAADRSHDAFAALVHRHADLVWSAALRLVGGDRHMAEDVAQVVFTALAVKAPKLKPGVILPGWLLNATRYAAADALKAERRRKRHEREAAMVPTPSNLHGTTGAPSGEADAAWAPIAPVLDESLAQLGESLRLAVVLRFFERKSMREVASRLGISEEAARQRVCRGLEKLRQALSRRSVVVPAAALATMLAARAVEAAPPGVAPTLASAASVASAVAGGGSHASAAWLWSPAAWTKGSAAACVSLTLLGSVGALVAWEYRRGPTQETVQLAPPSPTTLALPPGVRPSHIAIGPPGKGVTKFRFIRDAGSARIDSVDKPDAVDFTITAPPEADTASNPTTAPGAR
jgi:RNA polymerase sigma factor (sigma-70 family)